MPPTQKYATSSNRAVHDCAYTRDLLGEEVAFDKEEITAGSEIICAFEEVLQNYLATEEPRSWRTCLISGSAEEGEGEVKISGILQRLFGQAKEAGTYTGEESVVFVSTDSDLILVGVLATPFTNVALIDPHDYGVTMIGELFQHWSAALPNPPMPPDLLPSYRIDFAFLFLLSGCDYYDGLREQALHLWRQYRHLRANMGFFRTRLVEESFTVNVEFLRKLTAHDGAYHQLSRVSKNKRKTAQANLRGGNNEGVEKGFGLLRGALWMLQNFMSGVCVDYTFKSSVSTHVNVSAIRNAAQQKGLAAKLTSTGSEGGGLPEGWSLFMQYLAVMGVRGRFSKEVVDALQVYTDDNGKQLTTSLSVRYLTETAHAVTTRLRREGLTKCELARLEATLATTATPAGPSPFMTFSSIGKRSEKVA
ncbi:hypothetical protein AGDE_11562 [Angomonas deanei]|uniref:XRN 5'-3' exonuclease N-terminus, putative n=1 Tax=Angomonas deanei TaxID=59799 RepID=A0A7G2C708_9TRYP|nr:hypothetical protein AGDE_11562 [Angomonas deanei]CAD2215526.1 XRN 5'-3' exonuclease N-terminus, putative [Angomonas deanei]|eukprot:EPY26057.1 hypothetical protein AGDE_11562 [Angomonas deanei]